MSEQTLAPSSFDLGLGLAGTHVLVTGGAGLIGSQVVQAFLAAGANVSSLDISYPKSSPETREGNLVRLHADITSAASMTAAWIAATEVFDTVKTCVALASLDLCSVPQTDSLIDADPAVWKQILEVNVGGTFLTAQYWLRGIRDHLARQQSIVAAHTSLQNIGLVIVGSEAGHFGVRCCAAYAASKSAVQYGLLQSLKADAPRVYSQARVNVVAPGPVDTTRFREETRGPGTTEYWEQCEATTALRQPVPIEAVARSILFLASERWSGNVHGQILNVDSGKQGALMWHPNEPRE